MKFTGFVAFVMFSAITTHSPAFAEEQGKGTDPVVPLTVEESLLSALENNFEIVIQRETPKTAEGDLQLTESEFDPSVFASVTDYQSKTPRTSAFASPEVDYLRTDSLKMGIKQRLSPGTSYELAFETAKTNVNSSFAGVNPEYSNNITLTLTQPLLKGMGKDINTTNIVIARNTKNISDEAFSLKVMDVVTSTREVYWNLVYLNKELEVQKESLERARDFLKRIELQVEVGVLAPIEIAAAKAVVAVREEALIGIKNSIGNTEDQLKALINKPGLEPGTEVAIKPVDEPSYRKTSLDLQKLKELAYENRPDHRQALLSIENRKKKLEYEENQLYPTVNLQGSLTYKGIRGTGRDITDFTTGTTRRSLFEGHGTDSLNDMLKGKYYDYSVGLVVEYPLFNRAAKGRVARTMAELNQADATLDNLKQLIDLEVLKSAREVDTAEQRIHATRAARILAEEKLEAEIKKYDVGSSTSFTVLEYQNDLAAEKSKEIKAVIDYLVALARLERVTGTVLKNRNITLDTAAR